MTPRTPQGEVFWALLSSSEHSGVPEDSNSRLFQVLGFTPTLGQSRGATYILDRVWLAVFGKEDDNVCMWQPTLLKLNDIDSRNRASQNMVLVNVIDQLLQLDFEHSGYQIRSILRLLSEQQRSFDFKH
jgi:hypothetical protein